MHHAYRYISAFIIASMCTIYSISGYTSTQLLVLFVTLATSGYGLYEYLHYYEYMHYQENIQTIAYLKEDIERTYQQELALLSTVEQSKDHILSLKHLACTLPTHSLAEYQNQVHSACIHATQAHDYLMRMHHITYAPLRTCTQDLLPVFAALKSRLSVLEQAIQQHSQILSILQLYTTVKKRYTPELKSIIRNKEGWRAYIPYGQTFEHDINTHIVHNISNSTNQYPYVTYTEKLIHDITALEHIIQLAAMHPTIMQKITRLYQRLTLLCAYMQRHQRYISEYALHTLARQQQHAQ